MTIIHLIAALGIDGGAEQMAFKLAKKSKENNIETIAVGLTGIGSDNNFFSKVNIEHHFLNAKSFKDIFKTIKKLHNIIKEKENVVFHSHMFHSCIVSCLYGLLYKKTPIVFTMHTNKVHEYYRRILLFLCKPLRCVDIVFSENSKKWYLKNNAIIPNGIDVRHFEIDKTRKFDKKSKFSFLFIGRLTEAKNPLFMVDLANKLKQENYDFVIDIVGDGELREDFEKKINSENLRDYFNLHGIKNDIVPYLNNAHCLILPSLWEGLPLTIIEAASAKLPIVTTPVGSVPDFLNNDNAYVCNYEGFHLAMMSVINNYGESTKKAEKLFNEIKSKFDIDTVFKKHLKMYSKALKNT